MPGEAAVGELLVGLVVMVAVGTFFGAIFLRAAVALYNQLAARLAGGDSPPAPLTGEEAWRERLYAKMAGGARPRGSVPEPGFGKAMGIILLTLLVNAVPGLLIGLVTSAVAEAAGAGGRVGGLLAPLVSFPVGLLIMAAILSATLPTTFRRAILVTLCYALIAGAVVGVVAVAVMRTLR
jgi:hypothetical protein